MNKKQQIQFYNRQLKSSEELKAVAMQNYNLAAQIESEAKSALEMLGALKGQDRKVKHELSIENRLSLIGSLTK